MLPSLYGPLHDTFYISLDLPQGMVFVCHKDKWLKLPIPSDNTMLQMMIIADTEGIVSTLVG